MKAKPRTMREIVKISVFFVLALASCLIGVFSMKRETVVFTNKYGDSFEFKAKIIKRKDTEEVEIRVQPGDIKEVERITTQWIGQEITIKLSHAPPFSMRIQTPISSGIFKINQDRTARSPIFENASEHERYFLEKFGGGKNGS